MATKKQFRLKGKSRDCYMELVLDFPLASIKSDEHPGEAQRFMDSLLDRYRKLDSAELRRFWATDAVHVEGRFALQGPVRFEIRGSESQRCSHSHQGAGVVASFGGSGSVVPLILTSASRNRISAISRSWSPFLAGLALRRAMSCDTSSSAVRASSGCWS